MEAAFWHQRWQTNKIGFHEPSPNSLLLSHFKALELEPKSSIFVPLCGKTSAIDWFLSQGHSVVGAELSEQAVQELFNDLAVDPKVTRVGNLQKYSSSAVTIFVGDIFELADIHLGKIDAVFDRAALVALPLPMRKLYTKHLSTITNCASQLLITFEYDQELRDGPPFSVDSAEVIRHYQDKFVIKKLADKEPSTGKSLNGLRRMGMKEVLWVLSAKHD